MQRSRSPHRHHSPLDLWHEVPLVAQRTGMSCWAAAASMLIGWRDRLPVEGPEVVRGLGKWRAFREGLKPKDTEDLCTRWGLRAVPTRDHSVDSLARLLERFGPLWLGEAVPGLHVIVVTGMHGDGTPGGTTVRVNDPWPVGRGERYSLPFSELMRNYHAAARMAGLHAQLLHSGGRATAVDERMLDSGVFKRPGPGQTRRRAHVLAQARLAGRNGGMDMTLDRRTRALDTGRNLGLDAGMIWHDEVVELLGAPSTKNFKLSEFRCHDGTAVPAKYHANVERLMKNLQVLRDEVAKPVTIVSGYRTPAHNTKIGGASRSQHLVARAGDIKVEGMTPRQVFARILGLIRDGKMEQGGMGLYGTFVHYDVRGSKARWKGKGVTSFPKALGLDEALGMELGESLATFSHAQLEAFLGVLDRSGKIEGATDSDDKARALVDHWKQGHARYLLPPRRKILLLEEMIDGFTGDDDENQMLELLAGATDAEFDEIKKHVRLARLRDEIHGAERKRFDALISSRRAATATLASDAANSATFAAEAVTNLQKAFEANANAASRLNCILIIRDVARQLFGADPATATRVHAALAALKRKEVKVTRFADELSKLGLVSSHDKITFDQGNGLREPSAATTSAWDTIMKRVGTQQGWHVFGLAPFNGYHSVTIFAERRANGTRVYWADQWRIDPGDDFRQSSGSVSGFRRYERVGFDTFITEKTRAWWNEVHARSGSPRWETTCHIWKLRSRP